MIDADAVLRGWSECSAEYSPTYYAHHGPNRTSEALLGVLDREIDRDDAVLELGCSAGRHLAHLHRHGYRDLCGVDINHDTRSVMAQTYPELVEAGRFHLDAIEDVVTGFDDGQFAAVYSVETLQHIHPDHAWVFEEVARVVGDVLVTVEIEHGVDGSSASDDAVSLVADDLPLYYRDWHRIFTDLGLVEVATASIGGDTMRVFHPAPS